ncbi:hypothetical protein [Streptomyces sennicomposti]|uniref:hypothetical protein n=1 Tax=Streptomyces sennicomposti TaxID=2873384 RepID=UPI001CA74EBB|nr:hypothetical protein [Streptomyces sennicomposti]MBY8864225.1 hypothetical protein [Streptomyces sennicomposti]
MKKVIAATGLVLGGAAMVLATQGSAQAVPARPVTQTTAVADDGQPAPAAFGGLVRAATKVGKAAGRGYVHAKAAAGTTALRQAAGNMTKISSLGSASNGRTGDAGVGVEAIFDQ